MRQLARRTDATSRWILALRFNKAGVALAAKQARVLWALLTIGRPYAACPRAGQVRGVGGVMTDCGAQELMA